MSVSVITDSTFEDEVLKNEKPVLVDFWAEWCAPCRMISPYIDKISEETSAVHFTKINVDENTKYAAEAGVRGIPTIILYKGGKEVNRVVGADVVALKKLVGQAVV